MPEKGLKLAECLLLLNMADVMVWRSDRTGGCDHFNKRWLAFTGRKMEQELGFGWADRVHPADLERCLGTFRGHLHARTGFEMEYRILRHDGVYRWFRDRGAPFTDEKGEFAGYIGSCIDITDRKRAEESLGAAIATVQEEKAKSAGIIAALGDGISIQDTEFRVLYQNRIHQEFVGNQIGNHCYQVYESRDHVCDGCPVAMVFRDGKIHKAERCLHTEKGERHFETTASPLTDPAGMIVGGIEVVRDITERKLAEKALRHSEEQLVKAQKMEAVGRLAGGIAHDFNNLLTAISGYSDLILSRLSAGDPMRREVDEIRKAGERAASLTHQLLAFSRQQVLEPRVLDLNAVVANMEKMLRRLIGEDIELVTVLEEGLGAVKADPGKIEQVIVNLAVNSRDAMPHGGKLTIGTANTYLDESFMSAHGATAPGHYVLLTVSDTGLGMDEMTKSRLFEPFFTTKELGKGTGLGLSTVYGIVKQSEGYVWVYSEPGRGTAFKIYLPRVGDAVEELSPRQAAVPAGRAFETVLLVEDEEAVRTLIREILAERGYRVLDAPSAGDAILICERHDGPIHMMLSDVVMPRMGGRKLAERLAPLRPEMRVLYMSGYTDDAILHHGVLEPGTEFLQKPFTREALLRKVRDVLDAPLRQ